MKYTWLIDSGHGGIIDGVYQTAPEKMHGFPNGDIFYEGEFNRIIKRKFINKLNSSGIHNIDICPTDLDLSLNIRCEAVNVYDGYYDNCILISLHSNAGGGTGFEVFAHPNSSTSQQFGNILSEQLMVDFSEIKFRQGDGQLVKTANFQMLRETNCPAILPECLFFDTYEDYKLLIDPKFQNDYTGSLMEFVRAVERM